MTADRNCLSYWLPRLVAAGLPVPRTELVDAGPDWPKMLGACEHDPRHKADRDEGERLVAPLADAIRSKADAVGGYPLFLRTGHFSGKHDWSKACHVPTAESVAEHVRQLVFMSEMFGSFGELPWQQWAVRELLPVDAVGSLAGYGGMPLVREYRAFVSGGSVRCLHHYWPIGSVLDGIDCTHARRPDNWPEGLTLHNDKCRECHKEACAMWDKAYGNLLWAQEVMPLAQQAAAAFAGDGAWSVDLLKTRNGWYVTDCAEAGRSYHYPGCTA